MITKVVCSCERPLGSFRARAPGPPCGEETVNVPGPFCGEETVNVAPQLQLVGYVLMIGSVVVFFVYGKQRAVLRSPDELRGTPWWGRAVDKTW